jgi:nucleotide-binding universal stress UspA family protein
MRYGHVLVPVDLSDPDQHAIAAAIEIAALHKAKTTLMYVIEAIDVGDEDEGNEFDAFYAELEAGIRQQLLEFAEQFRQAGLEVDVEILIGHRPREIIRYSATGTIDLIVMQSHRIDLNRPYENLTSASHQVGLFCQCPVMLLK